MIRTMVCEKEGCNGNKFYIKNEGEILYIKCMECGEEYTFDVSYNDYTLMSTCSKCGNDVFKIFKDTEKEGIIVKCAKCGNPPEKFFQDSKGNQITYEESKLQDIQESIYKIDEKLNKIDERLIKIDEEQRFIEESMAYLNKFIASKIKD